jgi:hypothetical protein
MFCQYETGARKKKAIADASAIPTSAALLLFRIIHHLSSD